MQTIPINSPWVNPETCQPRLILLRCVAVGSVVLLLSGAVLHLTQRQSNLGKANPEEVIKQGDGRRNLTTPTQPLEGPAIITKKPEKPIVVEEGSEAWFCLQNNGGSDCLNRDRFALNYRGIAPPRPQKSYEDYLVQYGVRSGDCGRYLNGGIEPRYV